MAVCTTLSPLEMSNQISKFNTVDESQLQLDEYCVSTILMQSQHTYVYNSAVQFNVGIGPGPPVS